MVTVYFNEEVKKQDKVTGEYKKEKVARKRTFDSVNFDYNIEAIDGNMVGANGVDLRTGHSVAVSKDISYYALLGNYSNYISHTDDLQKEKIIDGKSVKTFGYLDFGLVPVFMAPIGLLSGMELLVKDYIEYMNNVDIKYYMMPIMNPFDGKIINTQGVNDLWVKRADLAKFMKCSEDKISLLTFHYMIGIAKNDIKREDLNKTSEPITF